MGGGKLDAGGVPLAALLTGGNCNDVTLWKPVPS
jgi:hypothetical protein